MNLIFRLRSVITLLVAWIIGGCFSFFLIALQSNADAHLFISFIRTFVVAFVIGIISYFAFEPFVETVQFSRWKQDWIYWITLLVLGRFVYKALEISLLFPSLFSFDHFQLSAQKTHLHIVAILIALGAIWVVITRLEYGRAIGIRSVFCLRKYSSGIILAGIFFVIYFVLANVFNRTDFNTNNVFFGADTNSWKMRLADESGHLMGMRAVHPLAFLLLRPPVQVVSIFFRIDLFSAVLLTVSAVGSASVFLVYFYIVYLIRAEMYAFLWATLFGLSAAQLIFNSLIESYVFSAFFLILFFILVQITKGNLVALVLSGMAIFGITISNLVQSLIGVFLWRFQFRRLVLYSVLTLGFSTLFAFVNRIYYPNSDSFLTPANYQGEGEFLKTGDISQWQARVKLVGSDVFLFNIIAPEPFYEDYNKDNRGKFPKFNFVQGIQVSRFVGLGKIAIWLWLGILGVGVVLFMRSVGQEGFLELNRSVLTFLSCLVFNFLFHVFYGFEPFLYVANWTYALIFFAALAWRQYANNKIIQSILLILIAMLTLNNISFLYFLMSRLSSFISP